MLPLLFVITCLIMLLAPPCAPAFGLLLSPPAVPPASLPSNRNGLKLIKTASATGSRLRLLRHLVLIPVKLGCTPARLTTNVARHARVAMLCLLLLKRLLTNLPPVQDRRRRQRHRPQCLLLVLPASRLRHPARCLLMPRHLAGHPRPRRLMPTGSFRCTAVWLRLLQRRVVRQSMLAHQLKGRRDRRRLWAAPGRTSRVAVNTPHQLSTGT